VLAERHEVHWRWVRGHAGHPQNEYAHHLATRAARDQTSSDGPMPSGFDEWLARKRQAGGLLAEPAGLPDGWLPRASRPLPPAEGEPDRPLTPNKGRRA
jgi:ribonuclease HI